MIQVSEASGLNHSLRLKKVIQVRVQPEKIVPLAAGSKATTQVFEISRVKEEESRVLNGREKGVDQ